MRISDWSSDVCSSDLAINCPAGRSVAKCSLIAFIEQVFDASVQLHALYDRNACAHIDKNIAAQLARVGRIVEALPHMHNSSAGLQPEGPTKRRRSVYAMFWPPSQMNTGFAALRLTPRQVHTKGDM